VLVDFEQDIDFRQLIDSQKILLVNLSKGIIGEDASSLLGAMVLHSIGLAAFSRADISEASRNPFYLYADEFQNFSTLSIVNLLSELRKFRLGVVLANQYLAQLDNDIKDAVLGNVGTIIAFRLGVEDSRYMAKEFYPKFDFDDIGRLPNYTIYLKLMIDGSPSKAFSADTLMRPEWATPQNSVLTIAKEC